MLKIITALTGILLALWCVSGPPTAGAALSPGIFVLSPEGEAETINNWARGGHILFDILVDENNNGNINYAYYYTFDNDLRLEKVEFDNGYNEVVNKVTYYFYGQNGKIERVEIDSNNDETINEKITYYYNEDDTINYQELDTDNNGTADLKITFVYDENGRLIQKLNDGDNDGVINSITVFEYIEGFLHTKTIGEYDPENEELTEGSEFYLEVYDYDEKTGNIIEHFINENYDDRWDSMSTFFYDHEDWLDFQATDTTGDERYDKIIYYVWIVEDPGNDDKHTDDRGYDDPPSASCFIKSLKF